MPNAQDPTPADIAARQRWMGILARSSAADLDQALAAAGPRPEFIFLRRPETGLAMVRGRMDAAGRRFNLGEMTLTRCAVRTADGRTGFAFVAGRDARQAELAALLDAMLQDPARQADLLAAAVAPLVAAQEARRREARSRTRATKVDFFTLVRGEDE
jgi:alpha-D-ribose 1-methylphosphonate 5-triphosphate synthase subunit PhnG